MDRVMDCLAYFVLALVAVLFLGCVVRFLVLVGNWLFVKEGEPR